MKRALFKASAPRPALSDLEHLVMGAVWASAPCSVETVHRLVSQQRDVKEVTVRTILRRLEAKGYVTHVVEGRAYIYRAVEAPRHLAARAVRHIIDRFCQGSVDELITGIVEADVLSEAELTALERGVKAQARGRAPRSRKGR
jgi:predicted transcriptional regulator